MPPVALNLDEFELAIARDWMKDLGDGVSPIRSLPTEFGLSQREDLIRLHAWLHLPDSPILFVVHQSSDTKPIDTLITHIDAYEEFRAIRVIDVSATSFENDFLQALDRNEAGESKLVVVIPFEKFAKISRSSMPNVTMEKLEMSVTERAWNNYLYMLDWLDENSLWPAITYTEDDDSNLVSTLVILSMTTLTIALAYDRMSDGH
jgi:hypothetical protein